MTLHIAHTPAPFDSATLTDLTDEQTESLVAELAAKLRLRDSDPDFADAPVCDVYARISRNPDGRTEKTGRQLVDILRRMLTHRVRLGQVHVDDNFSAWKRNRKRPGWDRLIERLAARMAAGVFTWHLDRLARQPFDLEVLIDRVDGAGAVVYAYAGTYDLSNSDHRFVLRILVANACKESDQKSARLRLRTKQRRELGLQEIHDRFGHRNVPPAQDTPEWTVYAAERQAIADGINAVLDGDSWKDVADEWNRRGLRSFGDGSVNRSGRRRGGHLFHALKVRMILVNPNNAGLIVFPDESVRTASNVEAIVDRKTWDRFCAVLAGRAGRAPRKVEVHELSGMLQCGGCDGRLSGGTQGPGNIGAVKADGTLRRSYRCKNSLCRAVYVDAAIVEAAIREKVIAHLDSPEHARSVARRTRTRSTLEVRLVAVRERQSRVVARFHKRQLTEEQFDSAMDAFAEEITELEAKLSDMVEVSAFGAGSAREDWATEGPEGTAVRRMLIRAAYPTGIRVDPPAVKRKRETVATIVHRLRPGTLRGIEVAA